MIAGTVLKSDRVEVYGHPSGTEQMQMVGPMMDFRSALIEMSDLLTVASHALRRISEREATAALPFDALPIEIDAIALRLRKLGERLRLEERQELLEQ